MKTEVYENDALRTVVPGSDSRLLLESAIGLCAEAGEAANIIKKHLFQSHPLDARSLVSELGDVAWYLTVLADTIDSSLTEVLLHNIAKRRIRYPCGFSPECSVRREPTEEVAKWP